jgi:hypothetical protein
MLIERDRYATRYTVSSYCPYDRLARAIRRASGNTHTTVMHDDLVPYEDKAHSINDRKG